MKRFEEASESDKINEAEKRLRRIIELANELDTLIDVGMNVHCKIYETQEIIVPGAQARVHTIIISKPNITMTLEGRVAGPSGAGGVCG